jgi:hypothetical protein
MDFDKNQFLTDAFEVLITLPGDPVRQIDHAFEEVIADHVGVLRKLAQAHRKDLLAMAEERKLTGKMVQTRWRF